MQINQLSRADSVSGGDLLPAFISGSSDTRAVPVSVLATFIQAQVSPSGSFITQYFAPAASGWGVTITPVTAGNNVFLLLTPTAGFASGTILLPAVSSCIDGQEVLVSCTQVVTALTVSGNGAVAVNGAPTTLAANAFFRLRFDKILSSWYRIG